MARKLFGGNIYMFKEDDTQEGEHSIAGPMVKAKRFNRQINICVEQHTYELYYKLRSMTGPYVSERIRRVIQAEMERVLAELEKARTNG